MKKTLLALALFAVAGTTTFAQNGPSQDGKKGKKETCTKGMAGGGSCCMKAGKTASVKPAAKATPVTAKM